MTNNKFLRSNFLVLLAETIPKLKVTVCDCNM